MAAVVSLQPVLGENLAGISLKVPRDDLVPGFFVGEVAVVGEEDQAAGIGVEAADMEESPAGPGGRARHRDNPQTFPRSGGAVSRRPDARAQQ